MPRTDSMWLALFLLALFACLGFMLFMLLVSIGLFR